MRPAGIIIAKRLPSTHIIGALQVDRLMPFILRTWYRRFVAFRLSSKGSSSRGAEDRLGSQVCERTKPELQNVTGQPHRLHLLYHELRTVPADYSYVLSTEEFKRHLDLFADARRHGSGMFWPEITFDDGHLSNYELALPMLAARDMTATFFITVGWTGSRTDYMGWQQLQAVHAAGHRIGAHGWTHTLLTHCDERALHKELNEARQTLEDRLGTSITTMSLPGGRYNQRVLRACEQAGYSRIYTSVPQLEHAGSTLVGRLNLRSRTSSEWLRQLLTPESSLLAKLGRQDRLKSTLKRAIGDSAYAKLWAVLNRQELDPPPERSHAE